MGKECCTITRMSASDTTQAGSTDQPNTTGPDKPNTAGPDKSNTAWPDATPIAVPAEHPIEAPTPTRGKPTNTMASPQARWSNRPKPQTNDPSTPSSHQPDGPKSQTNGPTAPKKSRLGRPRIHPPPPPESKRHDPDHRLAAMPKRTNEQWEEWFTLIRWPEGPYCPKCGGPIILDRKDKKPQPHRCKHCRSDFSVRTLTAMHSSKFTHLEWAMAINFLAAGPTEIQNSFTFDRNSRTFKRPARVRISHFARILGTNRGTAGKLMAKIDKAWCDEFPAVADDRRRSSKCWPKKSYMKDAIPMKAHHVAWAVTRGGAARLRSWYDDDD